MATPDDEETITHLPTADDSKPATAAPGSGIVSSNSQLVGKQLGDFQVLRRLGSGGMAEVFLAEQLSLKRPVALKVLRSEAVQNDDVLLQRFRQEAKAAAGLNHPQIVQVYAVGEQDGIHYIVQEYVPGLTLREWLRRNGPPTPAVAIRLLRQAALGLEAAYEKGIVHRDIKPENILLTKKGEVKVGDFGLAQLTRQEDRLHLTQDGLMMGTPLYMSPEQVAGSKVDHRSDLYSLGVTGYHMLAGRPPFRGDNALMVAVQHMKNEPPPLAEIRPDLPKSLYQIIHKLMEKSPDRRYQRAADLATDLRLLSSTLKNTPDSAGKQDLSTFSVAKNVPVPDKPAEYIRGFFEWQPRRHMIVLAALCALVAVLSGAVGWASRPNDPLAVPSPPERDGVAKAANAWEQFQAALFADRPESWQAVIDYWPEERLLVSAASVKLAISQLKRGETTEAERMFRTLTTRDETRLQATGYAGLAVIAALRNRSNEFHDIVQKKLLPLDLRNVDRDLSPYLEEAYNRNRELFEPKDRASFDDLLEQEANAP